MKQKHFITQKIILVFAIQFYNQIYICFFPIHIDPNISFDIGSSVLALEQEETMYVNNKIYKNTLSTYTRKKENAYNIAAKA
jgi:hypothetical protein